MKKAFTLAEVLITLAVVGVVAAMTIPTLISNYKKHTIETKLKRFYSTMNQAIKLSEIDNGSILNWEWLEYDNIEDETLGNYRKTKNGLEFYNKYLGPYLRTLKVEKSETDMEGAVVVYLPDGSLFTLTESSCMYYPNAKSYKTNDVAENITARDRNLSGIENFTFYIYHDKGSKLIGLQPYYYGTNPSSMSVLLNNNAVGCKENVTIERALCTQLIQRNGWKIPDNYFHKF